MPSENLSTGSNMIGHGWVHLTIDMLPEHVCVLLDTINRVGSKDVCVWRGVCERLWVELGRRRGGHLLQN